MSKVKLYSLTKKDFKLDWYSGSGAGGQHRNKHKNCARISHPASGAISTGQDTRSRERNKQLAFNRLVSSDKFQKWHKRYCAQLMFDQESWVDEQMKSKNIKTEYYTPND